MTPRIKKTIAFVAGGTACLSALWVVLLLLWIRDVHEDRKHTIIVNAATPVYAGTANNGGCHGARLTNVSSGAKLKVRRVRFLKDCAVIDVVLPDRQQGYVVLGEGDFSVSPPLPKS